jgi:hypothetical protein
MGFKSKSKIEPEQTDEQIGERIADLRLEAAAFRESNLHTVEGGHNYIDRWIGQALKSCPANEVAFAGGSRDAGRDHVLDVVASFVASSGEFRRWLRERVDSAAGREGVSGLSIAERDGELEGYASAIENLELELQRRALERDRDEATAALAALGGEAA